MKNPATIGNHLTGNKLAHKGDDDSSLGSSEGSGSAGKQNCCQRNRVLFIVLGLFVGAAILAVVIFFSVDSMKKDSGRAVDTINKAAGQGLATSGTTVRTTSDAKGPENSKQTTPAGTKKSDNTGPMTRNMPAPNDNTGPMARNMPAPHSDDNTGPMTRNMPAPHGDEQQKSQTTMASAKKNVPFDGPRLRGLPIPHGMRETPEPQTNMPSDNKNVPFEGPRLRGLPIPHGMRETPEPQTNMPSNNKNATPSGPQQRNVSVERSGDPVNQQDKGQDHKSVIHRAAYNEQSRNGTGNGQSPDIVAKRSATEGQAEVPVSADSNGSAGHLNTAARDRKERA